MTNRALEIAKIPGKFSRGEIYIFPQEEANVLAQAVIELTEEIEMWKKSWQAQVNITAREQAALREVGGLLDWALLDNCDMDLSREINAWLAKHGEKK